MLRGSKGRYISPWNSNRPRFRGVGLLVSLSHAATSLMSHVKEEFGFVQSSFCSRRRQSFVTAAILSLVFAAGCDRGGNSGNPNDFGPVDTSKAMKSEDAKALTPRVADDSSGKATPSK